MYSIDDKRNRIVDYLSENKRKLIVISISTFVWGMFAHAYIFFNEIGYHDSALNFQGIGATIISGRWMLWLFREIFECVFLQDLASAPWFNGFFSLILFGIIAFIISETLEIKRNITIILLNGILIVFPQVACMFFYMYTAPYYLLGTLLGAFGVYFVNIKEFKIKNIVVGIILMSCSVGTYQANIPFILGLMVLALVKNELAISDGIEKDFNREESEFFLKISNKRNSRAWVINIVSCLLFMILYFGITKLSLLISNKELSNYQNINSFGFTSLGDYVKRIVLAYKEFFLPERNSPRDMFPFSTHSLYTICIIIILFLQLLIVIRNYKNNKKSSIRLFVLLIVFPLASNFIFVMCDNVIQIDPLYIVIHGIMMYSQVLVFVYLILLIEHTKININSKILSFSKIYKFSAGILLLICFLYCRFSNMCYVKAELIQSHCVSYFNTLVDRIEAVEGYSAETPVVYIGENNKKDNRSFNFDVLSEISTFPYGRDTMINDYAWKSTIQMWCGFNPVLGQDDYSWRSKDEVKRMPCYPEDGSIRYIDGVIIVKFYDY